MLSRRNLTYRSRRSTINSRSLKDLRTLYLSLRSFPPARRLFSITSRLFLQNTRGGIPLRERVRCTEARQRLPVSPLLATLTHSVSRKSFPCRSYANSPDGGGTIAQVPPRRLCGNPVYSPFVFIFLRNCFSCKPFVATGLSSSRPGLPLWLCGNPVCSPFIFTTIQIARGWHLKRTTEPDEGRPREMIGFWTPSWHESHRAFHN